MGAYLEPNEFKQPSQMNIDNKDVNQGKLRNIYRNIV